MIHSRHHWHLLIERTMNLCFLSIVFLLGSHVLFSQNEPAGITVSQTSGERKIEAFFPRNATLQDFFTVLRDEIIPHNTHRFSLTLDDNQEVIHFQLTTWSPFKLSTNWMRRL